MIEWNIGKLFVCILYLHQKLEIIMSHDTDNRSPSSCHFGVTSSSWNNFLKKFCKMLSVFGLPSVTITNTHTYIRMRTHMSV